MSSSKSDQVQKKVGHILNGQNVVNYHVEFKADDIHNGSLDCSHDAPTFDKSARMKVVLPRIMRPIDSDYHFRSSFE